MEYCTVIGPAVYRVAEQTAVKEVTSLLPSLAEWSVAMQDQGFTVVSTERMRMAKASIGNAACLCSLSSTLCQGSKWLNGSETVRFEFQLDPKLLLTIIRVPTVDNIKVDYPSA